MAEQVSPKNRVEGSIPSGGICHLLRQDEPALLLGEALLGSDVDCLRIPVTTEETGWLVLEIFAHGLKLWPVDRECKEGENQGEAWVQPKLRRPQGFPKR